MSAPSPDGGPRDEAEAAAAREAAGALKRGVARVRTAAEAARVFDELEAAAAGRREGDSPARPPGEAGDVSGALERTERRSAPGAAPVLAEAGAQVAAASAEGRAVMDAAVKGLHDGPPSPRVDDGRHFLQRELLRRLRPLDAVDTVLFLAINRLPHPPLVDLALQRFSGFMTGGHAWALVPLLAFPGDPRRAVRAWLVVMPALWVTTAVLEYPVKRFFRRRRPFIAIVRSVVVGRKPASFSFPSGHSAAAFGGAVLLAAHYPRLARVFLGVAALVGFSRVYLGAHYPGDVAIGGVFGAMAGGFFAGYSAGSSGAAAARR